MAREVDFGGGVLDDGEVMGDDDEGFVRIGSPYGGEYALFGCYVEG